MFQTKISVFNKEYLTHFHVISFIYLVDPHLPDGVDMCEVKPVY